MNYIEEVVNILGLDMEEKFKINDIAGTYYFTDKGLQQSDMNAGLTFDAGEILHKILIGKLKMKEIPYRPQTGETYCYILPNSDYKVTTNDGNIIDYYNIAMGNTFKTIVKAKRHKNKILNKFKEMVSNEI